MLSRGIEGVTAYAHAERSARCRL